MYPKFQFDIDDEYDMLIFASSISRRLRKIHWSSLDSTNPSGQQASLTSSPIKLPSYKPNSNKQFQRKISNIDIHKYFGFRTLQDLKPFQHVSLNTITLVNAGEIPLEHGNFTTITRN